MSDLPPAESGILPMEEYLAMQRTIGEGTRYRVVAELLRENGLGASELVDRLDVPLNRLHCHLDKLVDVGLVVNRKRRERGDQGLCSYYVATSLGEAIMTPRRERADRREHALLERYA